MKYFNTITAKIESNLKIIIFTAIFIPVVDILYLSVFRQIYIDNYGINLTLADLFIIASTPWFFALSISFVGIYLALHIVKYDYNSTIIIIYKSRRRLWINQTLCTTGVSLCLAVYNLLSIMVIGKLSGVNNINWDTIESAFFKNTQTLSQTNIWQVIVLFFATTFLLNMITITIVIVSKWIFNNFFPGWIIVATLIWIDLSGGIGIPLIFNGMSIAYTPLLINMSYSGVFYGIVILTVFWIIGFVCSKEREFYDVF